MSINEEKEIGQPLSRGLIWEVGTVLGKTLLQNYRRRKRLCCLMLSWFTLAGRTQTALRSLQVNIEDDKEDFDEDSNVDDDYDNDDNFDDKGGDDNEDDNSYDADIDNGGFIV